MPADGLHVDQVAVQSRLPNSALVKLASVILKMV